MQAHPERVYLRLEQFLDLERQWTEASDEEELGHRIATTMSVMLDTDSVGISVANADGELRDLAGHGEPGSGHAAGLAALAIKSGRPELRRHSETTLGAFPFEAGDGRRGALEMTLPSQRVGAKEISFLRFLAALAGSYFANRRLVAQPEAPTGAGVDTQRYVAMAAHELRSPLALAEARLALLTENEEAAGHADTARELGSVSRSLASMSHSLTGLLDTERITDGRLCAKLEPIELNGLFEGLAGERFAHTTERLSWPGPGEGATVSSDPALLGALLGGLIGNALEHGSGPVTVSCRRQADTVSVGVSDRGSQLKQDQVDLLVSSPTRTAGTPAQGLGLRAIAAYADALGVSLSYRAPGTGGNIVALGPLQLCQSAR